MVKFIKSHLHISCVFSRLVYLEKDILEKKILESKTFIKKEAVNSINYFYYEILTKSEIVGFFTNDLDFQCYLIKYENTVFVVFRGSDSIKDWIINFLCFYSKVESFNSKKRCLHVHKGFYKQIEYENTRYKIETKCIEFCQEFNKITNKLPDRIVFCGHSLGGSQATIASYTMNKRLSPYFKFPAKVYTFGAPKCVLSKEFNRFTNYSHISVHNYVFKKDPIPYMPIVLFQKVGTTHTIDIEDDNIKWWKCDFHKIETYANFFLAKL